VQDETRFLRALAEAQAAGIQAEALHRGTAGASEIEDNGAHGGDEHRRRRIALPLVKMLHSKDAEMCHLYAELARFSDVYMLPAAPFTCELEEELVQLQQQNLFSRRI
jgi:hypothetical protein